MPGEDAATLARGIIEPSLRGIDTHGLYRVPQYVENFAAGVIAARPRLRFIASAGAMAILDADNGSGHVACALAMRHASDTARRTGVAIVSVRNSSHFGAAGTWALLAAEAGCIGLVWTNGNATVPPTGGRAARLHNTPLAIAVPNGSRPPLLLDIAMAAAAGAKIRLAAMAGRAIPADWALTSDGRPTTDAREGANGLLLPMAGHKGYGLAVMGDILSGILSGSSSGLDVRSQGSAALGQRMGPRGDGALGYGHLCLALDVGHFMAPDEFVSRVRRLVDMLHDTPRLPGVERILVPGERSAEIRAERLANGIPVDPKVLALIGGAAASVGAALPQDLYVA